VSVGGWCFVRGGVGRLEGIRARLTCAPYPQRGEYGRPRPDVRNVHPELVDDHVGFDLPLALAPGSSLIRIEVKRDGRWIALCRIRAVVRPGDANDSYREYLQAEATRLPPIAVLAVRQAESSPTQPFISLVLPIPDKDTVRAAIASVQEQNWSRWELILVGNASAHPEVRDAVAQDDRIRVLDRPRTGGICGAINDALASARGEWIAILGNDDVLSPYALALVAREIGASAEVDLVYADEDRIDALGERRDPFFRPDWAPLWLRSAMYLGRFAVMRRRLVEASGGCDARYDGIHEFELALRVSERARRVAHVPEVLYHRRTAASRDVEQLHAMAVQESLDRQGISARAEAEPRPCVRIVPHALTGRPSVSVLIMRLNGRAEVASRALAGVCSGTLYSDMEVIVGYDDAAAGEIQSLAKHPIRRVAQSGRCLPAQLYNRMASEARGELLLLLHDDIEVLAEDWLEHLVTHAGMPGVGAVGPLLVCADGMVQHSGFVLGAQGAAAPVMRGLPAEGTGCRRSLACAREVSALSGACLLVRAGLYRQVGGLSERFRQQYDDVDFCLRLRALGLRNVLVPQARLVHHDAEAHGADYDHTDRVLLLDRWEEQILRGDPYHRAGWV
jgi:GT2 family glycosyltransferase